jgi:hypothetical protein
MADDLALVKPPVVADFYVSVGGMGDGSTSLLPSTLEDALVLLDDRSVAGDITVHMAAGAYTWPESRRYLQWRGPGYVYFVGAGDTTVLTMPSTGTSYFAAPGCRVKMRVLKLILTQRLWFRSTVCSLESVTLVPPTGVTALIATGGFLSLEDVTVDGSTPTLAYAEYNGHIQFRGANVINAGATITTLINVPTSSSANDTGSWTNNGTVTNSFAGDGSSTVTLSSTTPGAVPAIPQGMIYRPGTRPTISASASQTARTASIESALIALGLLSAVTFDDAPQIEEPALPQAHWVHLSENEFSEHLVSIGR